MEWHASQGSGSVPCFRLLFGCLARVPIGPQPAAPATAYSPLRCEPGSAVEMLKSGHQMWGPACPSFAQPPHARPWDRPCTHSADWRLTLPPWRETVYRSFLARLLPPPPPPQGFFSGGKLRAELFWLGWAGRGRNHLRSPHLPTNYLGRYPGGGYLPDQCWRPLSSLATANRARRYLPNPRNPLASRGTKLLPASVPAVPPHPPRLVTPHAACQKNNHPSFIICDPAGAAPAPYRTAYRTAPHLLPCSFSFSLTHSLSRTLSRLSSFYPLFTSSPSLSPLELCIRCRLHSFHG